MTLAYGRRLGRLTRQPEHCSNVIRLHDWPYAFEEAYLMTVTGTAGAGYEPVKEILEKLVADGQETGAGLAIWKDDTEVVNLNVGWSDAERTRPWHEDTLVHTYSTSKPFAALAALTAVAQGGLGLDEPVSRYWREYGQAGKEHTTLRQILTHQAGQPAFPPAAESIDLIDEEALRNILAEAAPETPPGTTVAEHALTYGHIIDGVLRAATGRPLGGWFNDVARPALGLDAWFGVPTTELPRVATLEHGLPGGAAQMLVEVCPTYERTLALPPGAMDMDRINSRAFRQSTFAAINLHTSARGLARFYSTVTDENGPLRELLGEKLHTEFVTTQVTAVDQTVQERVSWTLGMFRTANFVGLGGLGGSAGYWSFTNRHAVAYVTRRLHNHARIGQIAGLLGDNLIKAV
ncbi:serine hydrolase [Micromonospora sp. WMMD1102]|uniref:serine hydrolase domain-containing protein n=1 Tax=Micromonospora sp. WMMD1102 TaxID=3016105 RepID=UPI0024150543|nr:serine hydrolase domain-containing protein [Micromonospora sp. WMMD1102]MDG4788057.1 serine hydrolase [Micromonospora sp. WMMD1102]